MTKKPVAKLTKIASLGNMMKCMRGLLTAKRQAVITSVHCGSKLE